MTVFDVRVNYEGVWMHTAMLEKGEAEVTLHFAKGTEPVGDLTIRFPSVAAVKEFIFNLECAFVDDRFIVEGEQ